MTIHDDQLQEMLTNVINEMEEDNIDPYRQCELDMLYGAISTAIESNIKHLFGTVSNDSKPMYLLIDDKVDMEGYVHLGTIPVPALTEDQIFNLVNNKLKKEQQLLENRLNELKKLQGE